MKTIRVVAAVIDVYKRQIKCYCKTKDVNQRSVFDATRMRAQIGTFGIKPQYITEIFVDKENAELASHIIHTL